MYGLFYECKFLTIEETNTKRKKSFVSFGQAVSEKIFLNRTIRNKNCLWWPCLLTDRDEMNNLYRRPSMDSSYQVSVHLAQRFQRRRLKCEKLTDNGRQVMAKAHLAKGLHLEQI
jgi:hypothetical protein